MKKLGALLLVVALLFGFGFVVTDYAVPSTPAVAGPGDMPPTVWPPVQNSIGPTTS